MTTTHAAEHFGVTAKTIRRWIRSGKLDADLVDGRWVIHKKAHDGSHLAHHGSHLAHLHSHLARASKRSPAEGFKPSEGLYLSALLQGRLLAEEEIAHLRDQLARRDEQVGNLTQLLAIAQKNVAVLTEQLSASRQMIEVKLSRSWWKRILSRF